AVIAPNGQEFGLTGGNASGGAGGTAKPYVRPRAPLGPSQQDYPVSCQCQSCQDVQNCIQNVNNWITWWKRTCGQFFVLGSTITIEGVHTWRWVRGFRIRHLPQLRDPIRAVAVENLM